MNERGKKGIRLPLRGCYVNKHPKAYSANDVPRHTGSLQRLLEAAGNGENGTNLPQSLSDSTKKEKNRAPCCG